MRRHQSGTAAFSGSTRSGAERKTRLRRITCLFMLAALVAAAGCSKEKKTTQPTIPPSNAHTWYVSPGGSNQNPGTRAQPLATPGFASRQLAPGDTLLILAGTYHLHSYDDDVITPPSGTAGERITIRGEELNPPVLAGSDSLLTMIQLSGVHYVTLDNLLLTSAQPFYSRDGIEAIPEPCGNLVFTRLSIQRLNEFGINLQDPDSVQIRNCVIQYCGFGAVGGPPGSAGGWRNVLIADSDLGHSGHFYAGGSGPSDYPRPDGFGIEISDGPVELARVTSEHNYGDGIDSKARNTWVHECKIQNNSCDGLKLWGAGSHAENVLIYGRGDGDPTPTDWVPVVIDCDQEGASISLTNLTVDDFIGQNYLLAAQYDKQTTPIDLTIRNCIWNGRGQNSPLFVASTVSLTLENNLLHTPASDLVLMRSDTTGVDSSAVVLLGSGNRYGDPRYASLAFGTDGDYHLQSGSPAIDAGKAQGAPSIDLEGHARPQGAGVDIGAYER